MAERPRPLDHAEADVVPADQERVDEAFLRIAAELIIEDVVEPPPAAERTDPAAPRSRTATRLAAADPSHYAPRASTGATAGIGRPRGTRARAWVRARSPPQRVSTDGVERG
jgi:hypothetical protein